MGKCASPSAVQKPHRSTASADRVQAAPPIAETMVRADLLRAIVDSRSRPLARSGSAPATGGKPKQTTDRGFREMALGAFPSSGFCSTRESATRTPVV
jgi:hypothetical protein